MSRGSTGSGSFNRELVFMKISLKAKNRDTVIELVGAIELLLGLITILFVALFDLFSVVEKPAGVFTFVVVSASISSMLGYGILNRKNWARVSVIFFSAIIENEVLQRWYHQKRRLPWATYAI